MKHFTFNEPRFGDHYVVYLDDNFEFLGASRHIGNITTEPLHYDTLSELPIVHRAQLEQAIWKFANGNANRNNSKAS